jgi:hypothetical protein
MLKVADNVNLVLTRDNDCLAVECVNDAGKHLASLGLLGGTKYAKDALQSQKYDVDWAEWSSSGEFIHFKEKA